MAASSAKKDWRASVREEVVIGWLFGLVEGNRCLP
jgi:hypothetical protein